VEQYGVECKMNDVIEEPKREPQDECFYCEKPINDEERELIMTTTLDLLPVHSICKKEWYAEPLFVGDKK